MDNTPLFFERGGFCSEINNAALFRAKSSLFEIFVRVNFSVKEVVMGRKLKVVDSNKKHLTNKEKEERKAIEIKVSDGFKELQKTPPRHLNEVARAEYIRIVEDLRTLPIRNLDRAILEAYCTWYSIYRDVSKKLDENGYTVFDENKGMVIPSPLIITLEKASANIRSSASQLGLTVDSRMKMFMPKQGEKKESVFDKFGG